MKNHDKQSHTQKCQVKISQKQKTMEVVKKQAAEIIKIFAANK